MGIASIANKALMFTFGDWSPSFAHTLMGKSKAGAAGHIGLLRYGKKNPGSIFSSISTSYKRANESSIYKLGGKDVNKFSFWNYLKSSAKSWAHEIHNGAKATGAWGKVKGVAGALGKGALKKMPLVGVVLSLISEVPNLINAFSNGIGTGALETGKVGVKLGTMAAGTAAGASIGTLICPGIGTFIGGLIGGGLAYMGADAALPSFTQKQEEAKAQAGEEAQAQAQVAQEGNSKSAILPKPYESPLDATGVAKPSFSGLTGLDSSLDLSGLTPDELQKYSQLKAAYGAFASNPYGSDYMDRNIFAGYPGQSVFTR